MTFRQRALFFLLMHHILFGMCVFWTIQMTYLEPSVSLLVHLMGFGGSIFALMLFQFLYPFYHARFFYKKQLLLFTVIQWTLALICFLLSIQLDPSFYWYVIGGLWGLSLLVGLGGHIWWYMGLVQDVDRGDLLDEVGV